MGPDEIARITHRYLDVGEVRVFYREAGPRDRPALLLLHGFPSSSHQFRRLFDALGARFHLIAPDYPGFGQTRTPAGFSFSFETLTDVMEGLLDGLQLDRFVLYAFDFGGPIGFRLAARRPNSVLGLVIQNANAYDEGLSEIARALAAERPDVPGARDRVRGLFTPETTCGQYEDGTSDPTLVSPDGWTLDQHFLDLPGRKDAQIDLALDYHTNLALYPAWQEWLRRHQPPALVLWGSNDNFFTTAGAHAYRRDLPDAELHLLDTGHFALEDRLPEILAPLTRFLEQHARLPGPLRLAVIGASGQLGSAVVHEARRRGHEVSALTRADADVTDPAAIAKAVTGHDAVIVAVKGPDRLVPRAVEALLEALPQAGVDRLAFLGGGGSLEYAPGQRYVDSPDFPAQYLETARDQAAALDLLRAAQTPVQWTYISPPPVHLVPGERTGRYRSAAQDTPLTDAEGQSRISVPDYASAIIDALEQRTYPNQRIATAY